MSELRVGGIAAGQALIASSEARHEGAGDATALFAGLKAAAPFVVAAELRRIADENDPGDDHGPGPTEARFWVRLLRRRADELDGGAS